MSVLYIKNMVCNRCILVVRQELERQGLTVDRVSLGEAVVQDDLDSNQEKLRAIEKSLTDLGFELIDDRRGRLVEAIKKSVIQRIHHTGRVDRKFNWSTILSEELHYEYNYLSNLFSSMEGITLEQYIIRQKIEKAKELLLYDELSLSEIADHLGYSSVAHLSGQFKKITGLTPSDLKKSRTLDQNRKPLDSVSD